MRTKRIALIMLLALFVVPWTAKAEIVSIGGDGGMNVYPFAPEAFSWHEEIYPMSAFSSSCVINSISYCNIGDWMGGSPLPYMATSLKIYMGVRETAVHSSDSDWTPLSQLTLVYSREDVLLGAELGWNEYVLDEPFYYGHDGNLVIVFRQVVEQTVWDCNMYLSSYSDLGNVSLTYGGEPLEDPSGFPAFADPFYADIQLNVTPMIITCPTPQNLTFPEIASTSATVTWTAAEGTSAWDIYLTEGEAPTTETVPTAVGLTATSYTFTGLTPLTRYGVYVRSNCGDGDVSPWKSANFLTSPDFGGSGTAEMPYLLYTKEDLEALNHGMAAGFSTQGRFFKVMRDIDGVTSSITGHFQGDFNGNGHSISIDLEGDGNVALFTTIGDGASIHDLIVEGSVNCTGRYAAGFVAYVDWYLDFSIWSCTNRTTVNSNSDYVGGIVGCSNGNGIIEDCYNRANISTTGNYCGGIGGEVHNYDIKGCENRGNISCNTYGGGIEGFHGSGNITNCVNKGSVTCSRYGGGITGECSSATIRNCYNMGTLSMGTYGGGISGYNINYSTIENCYNGGQITAANTTNCGALVGFNYTYTYPNGATDYSYNHYNYYKEGTFSVAYGTNGDVTYTDNYTSFTQAVGSAVCTLAQPILGTTNLLTALNNWRNGNNAYAQWHADIYGNNNYMPTFDPGTPPGLSISPDPIVMAPRPIGAWMQGEEVTLTNTSREDLQVTSIDFDHPYFVMDESMAPLVFPFSIYSDQSRTVYIGTDPEATMLPGPMEGHVAVVWNQNHVEVADITVENYVPEMPDVVELAQPVESLPQSFTQSTLTLYDNYKLPGDKPDGPDAVYQLTFAEDCLFSAQVTEGANAKLALYAEDFGGRPGPMVDNYYIGVNGMGGSDAYPLSMGGDDPIANLQVMAGTYYLVVSSTSPQYILEIGTDVLPLPLPVTLVAPADGATDISSPVELQWQLGQFTAEYQLLMGTSYPPTQVVVDWTADLAESYLAENLQNNQIYFWCVNERNSAGVTTGPVWGFTTTLNVPTGLHANTPVYVGDDVLLQWTAVSGRALVGYNVYQDAVQINDAPVAATEYTVSGLAYNMEGYSFAVTAVYDEGESGLSDAVVVRVGGYGTISGTVYEQDAVTPIAGATVNIMGYDEFYIHHNYTYLTDANGTYSGTVYAGRYIAKASKQGYQDGSHGSEVMVSNEAETSAVDIILYESHNTVGTVVAEYCPDSLDPQSPYVKIYWESENDPEQLGSSWHTYCHSGYRGSLNVDYNTQFGYEYPLGEIAQYEGFTLTKVALYSDSRGLTGGNYTCRIYVGGSQPEEGEMVSTITVDVPQGVGDWVEYDLSTPVDINGTEPVWVLWEINTMISGYPLPFCNDLISYGAWIVTPEHSYGQLFEGTWMMKQYFEDGSGRTNNRSFQHYNVYRTNCYNDGPYTEENTLFLETSYGDTAYIDVSWPEAEAGVYKWGVSKVYAGNREDEFFGNNSNVNGKEIGRFVSGINAFSFSRYATAVPNGWIQYDPMDPYSYAILIDHNIQVCAGDFANDGYMHAFTEDNQLLTFDPGSGQIFAQVSTTSHMDDCAFDYSTNTMFGVKDGSLYTIDLDSGAISFVGAINDNVPVYRINALACTYDGQLYGILTGSAGLFAIDKTNGNCTEIGNPYGIWMTNQEMSAGFDHNTGTLWWSGSPVGVAGLVGTMDLSTGIITCMASRLGIQRAFCIPYGYAPTPASPESDIVWSNCLDKDMWTTVEVSVSTNTGASPEGTSVRFINTSEPGQRYDYVITLDGTGYCSWDEFRKGTYNYTIEKDGYTSCGNHETIEIWEPTSIECVLEEIALQARKLYVSPTGWAMWEEGLGGDVLHYDTDAFDGNLGASGSPFYWAVKFTPEQLEGYGALNSVSFYDAPDQGFNGTFYVCETDSPLGHILYQQSFATVGSGQYVEFPLAQDIVFNNSESLWIVFHFEGGCDYPASACTNTGDANGRWISTDGLQWSDVAGLGFNYTWKIRCHVKATNRQERQLEYYRVFLDEMLAGNVTSTYLQHDVDNLTEGEDYTTKVQAVYSTGDSEWAEYTWTYIPCDHYDGITDLDAEVANGRVSLSWNMPEDQISGGQWYYYDNGIYSGYNVGTGGGSIYWGIMLPAGTWGGHYLGKVSVFDVAAFTGNILIYQGGDTAPETLVYSQQFVSTGSNQWVEYPINGLVELDESRNLWIVINNVSSAAYPAAYTEDVGDPNGRWISLDGMEWHDLTEFDIHGTWMVRAYATDEVPVVYNILGTFVFRDGELLTETPLPRTLHTYVDNSPTADQHEYSVRVVYDDMPIYQGDYYAMSCPEAETVDDVLDVDDNDGCLVSIYPNPANDKVTIAAEGMRHITLMDALGQVVYDADQKTDQVILNLTQYESGLYMIRVTTENGLVTRRVTVVR
ncbi:MAG: fibronectin type III domain-containing protein [Bacteroidales bacterium]|nr:fibronectin type III domain-containing protein [Bacteroidales bacterium]